VSNQMVVRGTLGCWCLTDGDKGNCWCLIVDQGHHELLVSFGSLVPLETLRGVQLSIETITPSMVAIECQLSVYIILLPCSFPKLPHPLINDHKSSKGLVL
jgi:hypothetical protein